MKDEILNIAEFSNKQYGVSLSGPIIKDKLFFYLNGERIQPENCKSARSLDPLEARVDESGRVFVKYQNFQLGTAERKPV